MTNVESNILLLMLARIKLKKSETRSMQLIQNWEKRTISWTKEVCHKIFWNKEYDWQTCWSFKTYWYAISSTSFLILRVEVLRSAWVTCPYYHFHQKSSNQRTKHSHTNLKHAFIYQFIVYFSQIVFSIKYFLSRSICHYIRFDDNVS